MTDLVVGRDGQRRCRWGELAPEYVAYHDDEWGREVRSDDAMFELLCLEAFQAGLSWITILRKRPAFRRAFAGFQIPRVAAFDADDVTRLLGDAGIVRNRAKIEAVVANARAAQGLSEGLAVHLWSFAPPADGRVRPARLAEIPARTAQSAALAKDLRRRGFRFVGPTTIYALMQATGMVDDHLEGCWRAG